MLRFRGASPQDDPMFTNPLNRGAAPFLFGVFLVCMCGLMLQIVETRIISVIVYYHLAFFAISMAMLGMTAGSLLVYFWPGSRVRAVRTYQAFASLVPCGSRIPPLASLGRIELFEPVHSSEGG